MFNLNCEFSEPVVIGENNAATTQFSKMACTSTLTAGGDIEAYEISFAGTTTPFYVSNIWSAPDILIVSGLALLCLLFIIKIIASAFLRKKIAFYKHLDD